MFGQPSSRCGTMPSPLDCGTEDAFDPIRVSGGWLREGQATLRRADAV
jgi:hypothetical protein